MIFTNLSIEKSIVFTKTTKPKDKASIQAHTLQPNPILKFLQPYQWGKTPVAINCSPSWKLPIHRFFRHNLLSRKLSFSNMNKSSSANSNHSDSTTHQELLDFDSNLRKRKDKQSLLEVKTLKDWQDLLHVRKIGHGGKGRCQELWPDNPWWRNN